MRLEFGKKYFGEDIEDVPDDYLLWIYEDCNPTGKLKAYLEENLSAIRLNVETQRARKNKHYQP